MGTERAHTQTDTPTHAGNRSAQSREGGWGGAGRGSRWGIACVPFAVAAAFCRCRLPVEANVGELQEAVTARDCTLAAGLMVRGMAADGIAIAIMAEAVEVGYHSIGDEVVLFMVQCLAQIPECLLEAEAVFQVQLCWSGVQSDDKRACERCPAASLFAPHFNS